MKRRAISVWFTSMVMMALAGAVPALAEESVVGTWNVNVAKSKFGPKTALKSGVAKWESYDGGVKLTVDNVTAGGETQHWESSGKFDGKDNPVTGNNPNADTMAFSKVGNHTYNIAMKKGGKTTLTARIVVAADGKTRITTQKGKNSQGVTVNDRMFYEKQ